MNPLRALLLGGLLLGVGWLPAQPSSPSGRAGLELQVLPAETLQQIEAEIGVRAGVLVARVLPGSAAARAGVQARDLILALDGQPVAAPAEVDRLLAAGSGQVAVTAVRMSPEGEFAEQGFTLQLPPAGPAPGVGAVPPPVRPGVPPPGDRVRELERQLQVLAAAREAGILTGAEYERKKAGLEAELAAARKPSAAPAATERAAAVERQLKALDAAREAGVLTAEEHARKREALEAELARLRAPVAPDPEVLRKLQALEAARQAGLLTEEEYARKRAEIGGGPPPGPAAGPAGEKAAPAEEKEAPGAGAGRVYRHPIGFSFGYPGDWQVKELEDGLQLLPPRPAAGKDGPEEAYLILGDTVEGMGITGADHPTVAEFLDRQIAAFSPALARRGGPAPVAMTSGRGSLYEWRAAAAHGELVARAYAAILNQHGVALVAVGLSPHVAARDADVRRIFASFGFGPGQVDRALAGSWSLAATSSLTNSSTWETDWSRARMVSERKSVLNLGPDGTWSRQDDSHMIAGAGGVWLEDKSRKESRGRWYAGDGRLYLVWEDNTWEDYKYELQPTPGGRELRLLSAKRGEIWRGR